MARLARVVAPGVPDHVDPARELAAGDVLRRGRLWGVCGVDAYAKTARTKAQDQNERSMMSTDFQHKGS